MRPTVLAIRVTYREPCFRLRHDCPNLIPKDRLPDSGWPFDEVETAAEVAAAQYFVEAVNLERMHVN